MKSKPVKPQTHFTKILNALSLLILIYIFLVSVKLMGDGFQMFGAGFAHRLISTTSDPFVGLFIGILATSIVQSSSMTTSMVVGFVASGLLTVEGAVPIVMGANIGTTVTSALVSLGHIGRPEEFRRAMAAATVHDFFNVITVIVLFPLELATGFLHRAAQTLSQILAGRGGLAFDSPVKKVVEPVVEGIISLASGLAGQHTAIVIAILSLVLLVIALYFIVNRAKIIALSHSEVIFDRIIGKNGLLGIMVGCMVTAIIQSSSVTTSLMVPLAGAGVVRLDQIFPIILGANVGTTITALLASLAGDIRGLTIALVHLLFNVCGILLIYPWRQLRKIPIFMATRLGEAAAQRKRYAIIYILGMFYIIPLILIVLSKL